MIGLYDLILRKKENKLDPEIDTTFVKVAEAVLKLRLQVKQEAMAYSGPEHYRTLLNKLSSINMKNWNDPDYLHEIETFLSLEKLYINKCARVPDHVQGLVLDLAVLLIDDEFSEKLKVSKKRGPFHQCYKKHLSCVKRPECKFSSTPNMIPCGKVERTFFDGVISKVMFYTAEWYFDHWNAEMIKIAIRFLRLGKSSVVEDANLLNDLEKEKMAFDDALRSGDKLNTSMQRWIYDEEKNYSEDSEKRELVRFGYKLYWLVFNIYTNKSELQKLVAST